MSGPGNPDVDTLTEALQAARLEIKRLIEENDDLRASAIFWRDLYDASLSRANRAEAEIRRLYRELPNEVRNLL
jgi:hypothetical protein